MINIIFISFEFPPLNTGGVYRPLKFAKYLSENGIRPNIYTLLPDDYANVYRQFNTDNKLTQDLAGKELTVTPIPIEPIWDLYSNKIKAFFNIFFNIYRSNEYKRWEDNLINKVLADSTFISYKAVFVTAPPFGMLRVAKKISALLNLPLIIDMRDAWAYWNMNGYGTYFHYLITLRKELKYFKAAAKVIATSDQTISDWLKLHPGLSSSKFECITNGYDIDSDTIIFKPYSTVGVYKTPVNIVYIGSFYYSPETNANMKKPFYKRRGLKILQYYPRKQDWLYRSPYFFFKALQRAFEILPDLKNSIKVTFAGAAQPWMNEMIDNFGLTDVVSQLGFVSHQESLTIQQNADMLLITSAKVENGKDCFIAGKTFEYITMNKVILAFCAEGSQKEILQKTGLAVPFDPDNTEECSLKLLQIFKNGCSIVPDERYIRSFERKRLSAKLANVIHMAIKSNS